jgi:uncharacterized protein
VDSVGLIDHHCHGVVRRDLDRHGFETLLTEAGTDSSLGGSRFDSRIGFAVRRWCAPVLDLPVHASPEEYLDRRALLGHVEVTRRFLAAAGLSALLVDTGFEPEPLATPAELGEAAGADGYRIGRLETLAEQVAAGGVTAAGFAVACRERMAEQAGDVIGWKSVAGYRVGLDLPADPPSPTEVITAAGRWLGELEAGRPVRLADRTLEAFLVWAAVETGLPVQFHVGYGDTDLDLHRCDPLLLTGLLRRLAPTRVPIMLLHNYPYHRQAGYLAQVFDTVFLDIGLAGHNVAGRTGAVLAEALELAPFGKVLYSSDAFGLPELYFLAALLFRRALRLGALVAAGNARRVYQLPPAGVPLS